MEDKRNGVIHRIAFVVAQTATGNTCPIAAGEEGMWNDNGSLKFRHAAGADTVIASLAASGAIFEAMAATTGVLAGAPDYLNGTAGVGATLTKHTAGAFPTQDGVTSVLGQIYLVKNQAAPLQNGLYKLTTLGTGSVPWVLTRLGGFDTFDTIVQGALSVVQQGTVNGGLLFEQTAAVVTVGTDSITFAEPTDLMTLSTAQTVVGAKDFASGSMKIDNNSTTNAHTVSSAATQARTVALPDVSLTVAQAAVASAGTAPAFTGTAQTQAEQYQVVPPTAETTFGAATLVTDVAVTAVALTIAAQPAIPCKLNIIKTDADNSYAATVTIVGVGTGGEAIAGEVVALLAPDGSHTYVTANAYAKITSITVSALSGNTGADHIAVGQASALGLPIPTIAASVVVYKETVSATPASVPVNEAVGTVDTTARTVIPTTAANGVKSFNFWVSFTQAVSGTVASHTHTQT